MLLCGGDEDPTVFYSNTVLMQAYWTTNVPSATVEVLDIDAGIGITSPFTDFQDAFAAAKALVATQAVASGATDGGASAVLAEMQIGLTCQDDGGGTDQAALEMALEQEVGLVLVPGDL